MALTNLDEMNKCNNHLQCDGDPTKWSFIIAKWLHRRCPLYETEADATEMRCGLRGGAKKPQTAAN